MANNHEQFIAFNKTINSNKRATLKKNRDALRERIKIILVENIQMKFNQNFIGKGLMLCILFLIL